MLAFTAAGRAERLPPAFSGPEVMKLDWNTRALVSTDLDGDGRSDLAVINNDRAALELLFQRQPGTPVETGKKSASGSRANRWEPQLEDARFRKETLVVGQTLFDLVAADFDGDGRTDLATTGEPAPLQIRFGREGGKWEERAFATAPSPVKFMGGLVARDLNNDGLVDLVMLGQKELGIFLQRANQGLVLDEKIPLGDDNVYALLVSDLDGDGRLDLGYLVPGAGEAQRVRLQVAPGKFGPERALPLKTPRSPLVEVRDANGPLYASALGASGQVEFVRFVTAAGDVRWRGLAPQAFTPLAGARGAALYATGDFNRDGASDLAVAFSDTAQVFVYLRQAAGDFTTARRVPSLVDIKALAAGPQSGGGDGLYVLSGKENALAVISFGAEGTASPPKTLPLPGRLIAMSAGTLAADATEGGFAELAVVAEEDGKRTLSLWTRAGDGAPRRATSVVLAGLRADPRAVTLGDLNQDGRTDALLAIPAVGLRVYLRQPDGGLADAADTPTFRLGLLGRPEMASAPLAFGDADGDGKPELLIAAENFLRALRIEADGTLAIVAQFDARDPGAEVTTGFLLGDGPGAPARVLLHDRKSDQLHLLARTETSGGASAVEVVDVRAVARLDVVGAQMIEGPHGRRELLLLGKDRFWWMPEGGQALTLKPETAYGSDLPDVRYASVLAADFDRDGRDELLAADMATHTIELLARDEDGAWASQLHFRIFEADPHYSGNRGNDHEPRDGLVADVTGDGKPDLVLLVHDRVLVYPQQ